MPDYSTKLEAIYEIAGSLSPKTQPHWLVGSAEGESRRSVFPWIRPMGERSLLDDLIGDGRRDLADDRGRPQSKLLRSLTQPEPTEAEARASLAQLQEYVRERWGAGEADHPAVDPLLTEGYQEAVAWLRRTSPKTLERMVGARQTFERELNDFAAQTTVSCRRAMEALANALYPPSQPKASRDGVVRQLDAARYKNRLLAYLDEAEIEPSAAKVVSNELERHASRLDSISRQFGQHVHAEPTKNDAWLVYVQSWLVLIEFARLSA